MKEVLEEWPAGDSSDADLSAGLPRAFKWFDVARAHLLFH